MMEAQIAHIRACLDELERRGAQRVAVRPEAMVRFDRRVQARLESSVFGQGCTSWYKTRSRRVTTNWPGTATEYWRAARRPAAADFAFSTAAARV